MAWPICLRGSQVTLARLTVLTTRDVYDAILRVKHRYPPTNESWHTSVITLCDEPAYTAVRVWEGYFCLNPLACIDAVEPSTWAWIKQLYR